MEQDMWLLDTSSSFATSILDEFALFHYVGLLKLVLRGVIVLWLE